MKTVRKNLLLILFLLLYATVSAQQISYPIAPKDSTYDQYFDTLIYDPYQWMENPEDPRLEVWLKGQNKITKKLERQQINASNLRYQIGGMYTQTKKEIINGYRVKKNPQRFKFHYKNRNYSKSPDFGYSTFENDNFLTIIKGKDFQHGKDDNVFVTDHYLNPDQTLVAVSVSHSGSDWREVYFFDLENNRLLPDTLKNLRFNSNIIWDGKGVYYDRYKQPEKGRKLLDLAFGQELYFHKTETLQKNDLRLYSNPDTTGSTNFWFSKLDSGRLLLNHQINIRGSKYSAMSTAPINQGKSFLINTFLTYPSHQEISFQAEISFGDTLILSTTWDAPNGKLLTVDLSSFNTLRPFVPEYDMTLRETHLLGKDKLSCIYRQEGKFLALIYNLNGELLSRMDFPEGKKVKYLFEDDPKATSTLYCISSFYHPDLWFEISLSDLTYKPISKIYVPYDPHSLETRYVTYRSKDGTEVPMYITCKKDIELNSENPTLLYGYGGYGTTQEPTFDESKTLWLLHGGVLAIPNIRGGGAAGEAWEKAGKGVNKKNAIDDFNAAAEYLINEGYTSPNKLASNGASHGGFLVTAAMVQRPELYRAMIAEAGAIDMLRLGLYTAGATQTNIQEFGSVENKNEFKSLLSYSPLHNIKKGTRYPNLLLITGDKDDRVPPHHSYKFLAALQEQGDPKSLYHLYIVPGAGHGGALTSNDWIDKLLYKYYFLFDQLNLDF